MVSSPAVVLLVDSRSSHTSGPSLWRRQGASQCSTPRSQRSAAVCGQRRIAGSGYGAAGSTRGAAGRQAKSRPWPLSDVAPLRRMRPAKGRRPHSLLPPWGRRSPRNVLFLFSFGKRKKKKNKKEKRKPQRCAGAQLLAAVGRIAGADCWRWPPLTPDGQRPNDHTTAVRRHCDANALPLWGQDVTPRMKGERQKRKPREFPVGARSGSGGGTEVKGAGLDRLAAAPAVWVLLPYSPP